MLKDFWFPILLTLAGIVFGCLALYMSGNGKRFVFTITALLIFLAVLTSIWGDPVRGPFAYLTNLKNPEEFTFQAGIGCHYPVQMLKDGMDFSKCVAGVPIQLWVKKTWWSGLQIKLTLMGQNNQAILDFDEEKIKFIDSGFDLNHDDYALELVGQNDAPQFQLIIAKDYSAIFVNAIIFQPNGVLLLRGKLIQRLTTQQAVLPENKLERIFKYPSSAYPAERR